MNNNNYLKIIMYSKYFSTYITGQANSVPIPDEDMDERSLEIAEDEDLTDLDNDPDWKTEPWPEPTGK